MYPCILHFFVVVKYTLIHYISKYWSELKIINSSMQDFCNLFLVIINAYTFFSHFQETFTCMFIGRVKVLNREKFNFVSFINIPLIFVTNYQIFKRIESCFFMAMNPLPLYLLPQLRLSQDFFQYQLCNQACPTQIVWSLGRLLPEYFLPL